LLIGDSVNSNTKDELRNHAERLGVSRNLIFKPRMPYNEIPGYIMQSDCAIMAYPNIEYWNNNNPIKLLEYMSLGKVIICTDMWTFRDVLKNSNSACYIKDNDPSTIANAIRYCYENRFKLKLWGKEGFEIVKNRFTWKKQAEELVNFIYKLCKNKNFCNL
jgi:glycosyltransferase involved in cell wall biosynthesis